MIKAYYRELNAGCHTKQLVDSGWIAIPNNVSLDEVQATRLFGAWPAKEAA
ncbi:hypothetical protein [Pseudomonas paeninsulae]|uniref:hypothetical protein n=1 Tax=Pseudomonas paeninsulae TaxID=3110772 RepID=UPI002D777045|nr:hypothetical protein [Pseudomonas sp. IT1137]